MDKKITDFFKNTFERRDARIIAVIVILALIAGIVIATTRGEGSDEASFNDLSPVTDYVYQPNDSLGPDPFGPSFANYTLEVPTEELSTGTVSSDSTGLYGGTGENSCDVEKMIEFLINNPDRAAAWAGVQGIAVDEIPDYLRSLTAVVLLENTLVINHGYSDGSATPFLAVLEAGTAVLVDDDGIPRARCACGNPLTPPEDPPTTEETTTTTSEPEITITESDCPEFDGEPPYGFTQESDGKWTLHTPEGRYVWDATVPGWHSIPDDGSIYPTESDVPGYDVECWPCPPESSGDSSTPSYEKGGDNNYRSSPEMLEKEGKERTEKYVVIKAFTNSSTTTTTEDSTTVDIPEVETPEFDTEEIDPETTEEFEPEYDDESTFDGCFPPCPEDGEWGWKIQARPDGNSVYVWVAPDGTNWYWNDGVWEEGTEIIPLSNSTNTTGALFVGATSEESSTTYTDYKDLPGWSDDCFECPPWGWVEAEDGGWEWHDPSGTIWTADIYGEWYSGGELFVGATSEGLSVSDITELPGYDEDCNECPEWGWTQTEDGSWVWIGPDGTIWEITSTTSGWIWSYEAMTLDGKIRGVEVITDLPGYLEDCNECPEWGWGDIHSLFWLDPAGKQWFASMSGVWKTTDPLDGEIDNYKDLPGYIEECNECPPWGWVELEDGSWWWDGGLEVGWILTMYEGNWQWVSEEGTFPHADYKDLPNFDPDCHECPEWGWAPEGDIWYWVDPNGVTWIPDASGNWDPEEGAYPEDSLNTVYSPDRLPGWYEDCHDCGGFGWNDDDGDGIWVWVDPTGVTWTEYADGLWYPDNGADPIGFYTRLPGWDDNCDEGPPGETTTTSTTSTTTTTEPEPEPEPGSVPDAPTLVSLTPWDGAIGVDWREPTYEGTSPITDFVIQTKAGSAGPWTTVNDGVSPETFGVALGLLGTEQFFRVAAVNSVGTGPWSDELSGVPFSFDPYGGDAGGNLTLYWRKGDGTPNETYFQLGVRVNNAGSIETLNTGNISTAGSAGSVIPAGGVTLTTNKDTYGSGQDFFICGVSYDFYVRVIDTDFFGTSVTTNWVNFEDWKDFSFNC